MNQAVKKTADNRLYLKILISLLLVIGIFFRIYHLDRKIYWHDEVYTSIRTAGYNGKEVIDNTFNGNLIEVRQLLKYQSLNEEKTWQDSWNKLLEHPEHPPLYYLLSRGWQQLFGSSIAITRSLSVVFSIILLPIVFWFCWELFNSLQVGWWAMGVLAISPVQVLYAQEAREYSLLLVTTALTCIALIGAVKRNNWFWWGFYTVSLAVNLYVSLLAGYIAITQACYIFILEKFRLTKTTINFLISGIIATILFSPWLWIIYSKFNILKAKTSWTNMSRPFVDLLRSWELHLSSAFIDLHPQINGYIAVRIAGFLLVGIILSYQFLVKRNSPKVYWLMISVTIIPVLMLIIPDVIDGGIKSIMTRYFLPSLLIVQIVVAYWLAELKNWRDYPRIISLALIIIFGIISCTISSQSLTWWNKIVGYDNVKIAQIINSYSQPLVIANTTIVNGNHDVNVGDFISLSYLLEDKVSLALFKNQDIPILKEKKFSNVLLWNIREETRINFENKNHCKLEIIEGEYYPQLWLMKPLSSIE